MPHYTPGVPSYQDDYRHPKTYGVNPATEDFCPHLNENIMRALNTESIETTYRENYIDYSGYYKRNPLARPPKNSYRLSVPKDWLIPNEREKASKIAACKSVYGDDYTYKGPADRANTIGRRETSIDLTDGQPVDSGRYRDTTTGLCYSLRAPPPRNTPCATCHYYHSGPPQAQRPPAGLTCEDTRGAKREGADEGHNVSSNASSNPYFDNLVETYVRYRGGLPHLRGVFPKSAIRLAQSARNLRPAMDWFQDSTPPQEWIPSPENSFTNKRDKRFVSDPHRRWDPVQAPKQEHQTSIRSNRSVPTNAARRIKHKSTRLGCEEFLPQEPYSPNVAFQGRRRPSFRAISPEGNTNCHRGDSGDDVRVCRECQTVFKPVGTPYNRNVNQGESSFSLRSCPSCCLPIKPSGVSAEVLIALLKDWQEKNSCPHCGSPTYDLSELSDVMGECTKTHAQHEAIRDVANAIREAEARGDCYGVVETVVTGYYFCKHDQECCNPVRDSHAVMAAAGSTDARGGKFCRNGQVWENPLNGDRFQTYNIACTKLPHAMIQ